MKRLSSFLLAATLTVGLIAPASADPDDRHWRKDHRPKIIHEEHHHYHAPPRAWKHRHKDHGHDRHHDHHNDWIGPAAVLAIGGLVIGSAIHQANTPARTVRSAPPPPSGDWYYCRSSRQYYPHTQFCPEGWLPVRPH